MDQAVGAITGAGFGALVGALDPTEGVLAATIAGGTSGVVGDLIGQDVTQIRKMNDDPLYDGEIDYAELTGAGIGGAIGGGLGFLGTDGTTGAASEFWSNLLGGIAGFGPSTFGGPVGAKAHAHPCH